MLAVALASLPAAAQDKGATGGQPKGPPGLVTIEVLRGGESVTEAGFVSIAGEVKNTSSHWLEAVRVQIELLDASGRPIRVGGISEGVKQDLGGNGDEPETAYAYVDRLAPGATAPFSYLRDAKKLSRPFKSARLAAAGRKSAPGGKVSVRNFKWGVDGDYFENLSGELVVESGECYSAQVALVQRGADGKVTHVDTEGSDEAFQKVTGAGQSVKFKRATLGKLSGKLEASGFCGVAP